MGKFVNGVLGTCTGKVGGVVGRTWKGINTVASYQPNVSNPRTNAQVGQRSKMSSLTRLASALNTGFIKPLWDRDAKKMSGFNAFIQSNMTSVDETGVIDLASLTMSKGKITAPVFGEMSQNPTNFLVQFGIGVSDAYGLPSDRVYCAAITGAGEVAAISSGVVERSAGEVLLDIPAALDFAGYIFLAFRRADGSMTSASSFAQHL